MPTRALNDRFVAGCKAPKTRITHFDTKVRGLALRVAPSGLKAWWFVYRFKGKPSQWLSIGTYPALKLVDARKQAIEHRRTVDVDERDPVAVLKAEQQAAADAASQPTPTVFTFGDLCDVYVRLAPAKKKTWNDDRQKIEKYLRPAWGARPLRELTRADVHALLDGLVGDGMKAGVNRVQALVSRLFTVAVDRSLIDAHPAARMEKRFKERAADRVLTDDELKALLKGLEANPGRAADALRLRLLLGQRGAEIAGMAWTEVDLQAGIWQLPGARTKNGRPHTVPLPDGALVVLKRRRKELADDEPSVFPFLTLQSDDHRALSTLNGGAYEWKDLRRTVATRLAGLGYDETTIGRVLNHARVTVTAKHYNQHQYLDEKRAALAAWDRELSAIVSGKRDKGKVVAHRPRRRA